MGSLLYANLGGTNIDDRLLSHLRIVISEKLRRREPFMLELPADAEGRKYVWISQDVPLQFVFYTRSSRRINPAWLHLLIASASSPNGLILLPEPPDGDTKTAIGE